MDRGDEMVDATLRFCTLGVSSLDSVIWQEEMSRVEADMSSVEVMRSQIGVCSDGLSGMRLGRFSFGMI